MKERDSYLDILKGVGIVLVVFVHTYQGGLSGHIQLFLMPLFFFLSGAALNYSKNRNDLIKRFKHIMIPYFTFSLVCFLYWVLIEMRLRPVHDTSIFTGLMGTWDFRWQQFINIFAAFSLKNTFLYNIVLWFLPCLFVAMSVYCALDKLLKKYALVGIVVVTSMAFVFNEVRLPWCGEIAIVALPFIFGGERLYGTMKSLSLVVGVGILLFSIILILVFSPHVSMRSHGYGEWWLFYLVAFALLLSICIFCKYLVGEKEGILDWLGRNSLTVMCIHEPIKRILLFLISKVSGLEIITLRTSIVYCLGVTVLLIMLLTPIVIAINRYIPWVIGNRKVSVDTKQLANQSN